MILLIDNYDSFSYNLYQLIGTVNPDIKVIRNDEMTVDAVEQLQPELAEMIQNRMIQYMDPENHRQAKANDSYYLLKKTGKPIVIVECGFLSNSAEAEKLCDNYYQEKVAWNIHMSIMQYLNTREK